MILLKLFGIYTGITLFLIRLEAIANSFLSLFILFPFGPFQEAGPRASQHTSPCVHAMVLRC